MVWLSPDQLADRCRRAAAAALAAGRDARTGRRVRATVLHDVFSVVVRLDPTPVVARVPVVLPPGYTPQLQHARQQRELDVVGLAGQPRECRWCRPARWCRAPRCATPDSRSRSGSWPTWPPITSPTRVWRIAESARTARRSGRVPAPLPFLAPFNEAARGMFAALQESGDLLGAADVERARAEYAALRACAAPTQARSRRGTPASRTAGGAGRWPVAQRHPHHHRYQVLRFRGRVPRSGGMGSGDAGPEAVAEYDDAAVRLGLRPTDPAGAAPHGHRARAAVHQLRRRWCLQLPVLADGLASVIDELASGRVAE